MPPPRSTGAVSLRARGAFVGRLRELAWLEECWREAEAGRPSVVLLSGEAGIGKTRLMREFRVVPRRAAASVNLGRAYEDLALPYLPLAQALEPRLQAMPQELVDRHAADLEDLRAVLDPRTAEPDEAGGDASPQRGRLFLAAARLLIGMVRQQPMALLLDDLHWADGPTIDLLQHLTSALSDAAHDGPVPLMVVCSHRRGEDNEPLERALSRMRREEVCSELELDRFGEPELLELLDAIGIARPSPRLLAMVRRTARGNPLFVKELLEHLSRRGLLVERSGRRDVITDRGELGLPRTVTDAIASRTRDLGAACRETLIVAACLGDRFDAPSLAAASEREPEEIARLLEEAVAQRILHREGSGYEFSHPLVREALYELPGDAQRAEIHWRIAQALERLHEDDLDAHALAISHHLTSARGVADRDVVFRWARRAAEQASAMCAWEDAARYHEVMLATGEDLEPAKRAELHYRAGVCHARASDGGLSTEHLDEAVRWYRECRDPIGVARAQLELARVHVTILPVPYGSALDASDLEESLASLGDEDTQLRGQILALLSEVHWTARQPERAIAMAESALELGRKTSDADLCAKASDSLALAQSQVVRVAEAVESQRGALRHAAESVDPWLLQQASHRLPLMLAWAGELDEADARGREIADRAEAQIDWTGRAMALAARAAVAVSRGEFSAADRFGGEALLMAQRSGYPWGGFNALLAQACGQTMRGAWAAARGTLDVMSQPGGLFDEPGPAIQFLVWVYRQLVNVRENASAETTESLSRALGAVIPDGEPEVGALAGFCASIEIAELIGAPRLAEGPAQLIELASERGALFSSAWPVLLPRSLGCAASLAEHWPEAEGHFRKALEVATGTGARAELARTHLDFARMLMRRGEPGDSGRASRHVERALPVFGRLGMLPFSAEAEALAAELDALGDAASETEDRPADLSSEEAELLAGLARTQSYGPAERAGDVRALDRRLSEALSRIRDPEASGRRRRSRGSRQAPMVLMLTDMQGSTEMIDRLGDRAAHDVMKSHDQILRACLRETGGDEVEHTGDGLLASFESASQAVECAVRMQRSLALHNEEQQNQSIRVRIALAAGEPLREGDRLFGSVVNVVARICARTAPDQIVASDVVAQLAAGVGDLVFEPLGRFELKGFERPFDLQEVIW